MENIGKDRWLICIALLGHFIRMKSTSKYYFCILKLAGFGSKLIQRKILKFKKKSESGSNLNFGSRGKISYNNINPKERTIRSA